MNESAFNKDEQLFIKGRENLILTFEIVLSRRHFQTTTFLLGFKSRQIIIDFDKYIYYENDNHFILRNKNQRINIIESIDLEKDTLVISDEKGKKIELNLFTNGISKFQKLIEKLNG